MSNFKKSTKIIALALCLCLFGTVLIACNGGSTLSGTYSPDSLGFLYSSYTFSEDGTVTYGSMEGTYVIEGDTIIFDFPSDNLGLQSGKKSFKRDGQNTIIINEISFSK